MVKKCDPTKYFKMFKTQGDCLEMSQSPKIPCRSTRRIAQVNQPENRKNVTNWGAYLQEPLAQLGWFVEKPRRKWTYPFEHENPTCIIEMEESNAKCLKPTTQPEKIFHQKSF